MKSLALLTLTLVPLFACAAVPPLSESRVAPENISADDAYNAAVRLIDATERRGGDVTNGPELLNLGMKAFVADPKDNRAQRVLVYLALLPQSLSKADLPAYENAYAERMGALRSAPAASEPCREGLEYLEIYHEVALQFINPAATGEDLEPIRRRIDALQARPIESPWIEENSRWFDAAYGDVLTKIDIDAAKVFWTRIAGRGDPEMADFARGKLRFIELKRGNAPVEISFTAADGRPVDVAELRGKVVLVTFWATWCPGCITEIPALKRVYEAYHDQGLEIIGISCEYADLQPGDSPEAQSRKLSAAKNKLLRFTAAHGIPWPQYFDGKGLSPNEYAIRFGVDSLPFMFLLDRQGKFAEASAFGTNLDLDPIAKKLVLAPP